MVILVYGSRSHVNLEIPSVNSALASGICQSSETIFFADHTGRQEGMRTRSPKRSATKENNSTTNIY